MRVLLVGEIELQTPGLDHAVSRSAQLTSGLSRDSNDNCFLFDGFSPL